MGAMLLVATLLVYGAWAQDNARPSMYRPRLYDANTTAESERLEAQVAMSWYKEWPVLQQMGIKDVKHLLQVGCGPGHYSEQLLAQLPSLRITCVERNHDFVRMGSRRLEQRFAGRVRYIEADAADLEKELGDATFDGALVRLLLQHLPGRQAALVKRMATHLEPGAPVMLLEVDGSYADHLQPAPPLSGQLLHRMNQWRSEQGVEADSSAGIKLRAWLEMASLLGVQCEVALSSSDDYGMKVLRTVLHVSQYWAVASNKELLDAEAELLQLFPDDLSLFDRDSPERPLLLSMMFICSGKVPHQAKASQEKPSAPKEETSEENSGEESSAPKEESSGEESSAPKEAEEKVNSGEESSAPSEEAEEKVSSGEESSAPAEENSGEESSAPAEENSGEESSAPAEENSGEESSAPAEENSGEESSAPKEENSEEAEEKTSAPDGDSSGEESSAPAEEGSEESSAPSEEDHSDEDTSSSSTDTPVLSSPLAPGDSIEQPSVEAKRHVGLVVPPSDNDESPSDEHPSSDEREQSESHGDGEESNASHEHDRPMMPIEANVQGPETVARDSPKLLHQSEDGELPPPPRQRSNVMAQVDSPLVDKESDF